jgi:hypothetical protein
MNMKKILIEASQGMITVNNQEGEVQGQTCPSLKRHLRLLFGGLAD